MVNFDKSDVEESGLSRIICISVTLTMNYSIGNLTICNFTYFFRSVHTDFSYLSLDRLIDFRKAVLSTQNDIHCSVYTTTYKLFLEFNLHKFYIHDPDFSSEACDRLKSDPEIAKIAPGPTKKI